jgi:hypothetical protein
MFPFLIAEWQKAIKVGMVSTFGRRLQQKAISNRSDQKTDGASPYPDGILTRYVPRPVFL